MTQHEHHLPDTEMAVEEVLTKACAKGDVPGIVCVANGPNGFHYCKAFGSVSVQNSDGSSKPALQTDALFWIASCTKLMTTIAALQCVERGLFTLDEPVSRLLPELRDLQILKSFDAETKAPILEPNPTPITLRHLLTHSSGIGYDHFSPPLIKYLKYNGKRPSNGRTGKIRDTYLYPLTFEPGTSFEYGASIDWAGQLVERATKISLSAYLEVNLFQRLGMASCTFRPYDDASKRARVLDMAVRDAPLTPFGTTSDPTAKLIRSTTKQPGDVKIEDDYGGAGCFCSMPDYAKMLKSITENDERLLKRAMVEEMFTPQLGSQSRDRLALILQFSEVNNAMGGLPPAAEDQEALQMDWGLGGQITPVDVEGRRRKGSMFWGGLPNLFWFIDRTSGVSGVFATQLMPTGDPKCVELMGKFESAIYEAIAVEAKTKNRGRL